MIQNIKSEIKANGSNLKATFINIISLKRKFVGFVKDDIKHFNGKNIAVYYELLSRNNCQIQGLEYGESFNAIDGICLYQEQKGNRERVGYKYSKPTPVVINGVKMNRIIITIPSNSNSGDFFGLASGYLQAENQIVCYMKYIK